MWVYRRTEIISLWAVGYYTPNGDWVIENCYDSREKAARMVNYLNGGNEWSI